MWYKSKLMKKTTIYRKPMNTNLFEEDITINRLSSIGNPLEQLSSLIDFEQFRPTLETVLVKDDCKTAAGRAQFDSVLMFKILLLKRYYGLGDTGIEYQIVDRTSFRKFLGISTVDEIPVDKTIWHYQEMLTNAGAFDKLFDDFNAVLLSKGLFFNEGQIVDASFVEAPRQRNSREENKQIKAGNGNQLWNPEEGDTADVKKHKRNKKRHKDIDARWTQKGGVDYYGYKAHAKVDKKTKLIKKHLTTPANVHDSQMIGQLLDETDKGQTVHLDSGYAGQDNIIKEKEVIPIICEKGCRYKKLTQEQIDSNHEKSKIRCRVEHVFGFIEQSMHGSYVRTIGLVRAKASVALMCLIYNMFRYIQIHNYYPQYITCKG